MCGNNKKTQLEQNIAFIIEGVYLNTVLSCKETRQYSMVRNRGKYFIKSMKEHEGQATARQMCLGFIQVKSRRTYLYKYLGMHAFFFFFFFFMKCSSNFLLFPFIILVVVYGYKDEKICTS